MRWIRRTEDGAYIVRRTCDGWTVETVNKRGRNLFGPRLVTPAAALAILRGTSAMGHTHSGLPSQDARALRGRRETAGGRHPASGSPPRPRR